MDDSRTKINNAWSSFLVGIIEELIEKGIRIQGFDCEIQSDIPVGAGLSSSAALCCGFIKTIDALFDFRFTQWEIIYMAQAVENNFIGVQSGFMDQFASVFGKKNNALLLNCATKEFN